jgi:3-oxoacyl-[acyl-carrier protein] reductase
MKVIYPDLKDKAVLVTGATRGIGREIAKALAAQGAFVLFNYRGEEAKAEALCKELMDLGGKAKGLHFDVTDTVEMTKQIEAVQKEGISISGLVNNAGVSKDQLMLRLKEDDLDQTLNINLKSAIMLSQVLTKNFLRTKDVSIVNMSSVVGLMGNASQVAYAASKAGLIGFTKSYAKEMASRQVRCNAVCPGFIETDMTSALGDQVKETYMNQIPLKRMGKAEDVAGLVLFLLSQTSSYITGEVIKVDGGLYI